MKSILETLKPEDEQILTMLNYFAQYSSGVQQALYKQKAKDADSVDITSIYDLLKSDEIKSIKSNRLKMKECYRNAFVTCETLDSNHDVKYVEGYINMKGLPIEHAWVKVDGKYIDPTLELVLHDSIDEDTYVMIGEFDLNTVRKVIVKNGFWGQIYDYMFLNKYKEKI